MERRRRRLGFLGLAIASVAGTLILHPRVALAEFVFAGTPANAWSPCYTGTCQVGGISGYNGNDGVDQQQFYPNEQGLPVTITQYNTGQYVVLFPGNSAVPAGTAGNVQVTALGSSGERCKVQSFAADGEGNINVYVNCFSAAGDPVNSRFTVGFLYRPDFPGAEAAYFDCPTGTESNTPFSPDGATTWNSTNAPIYVNHTAGSGEYLLTLYGQNGGVDYITNSCVANNGVAEVTALGTDNSYCNLYGFQPGLNSSGSTNVTVKCFDGSTGAATDSAFLLNYSTMSPSGMPSVGFTFAYQSDNAGVSQYSPVAAWSQVLVNTSDGNIYVNCEGADVLPIVTRRSTGVSTVTFGGSTNLGAIDQTFGTSGPLLQPNGTFGSDQYVKVTAFDYTGAGLNCETTGWYIDLFGPTNDLRPNVNVACFNHYGQLVDADYMVTFSSNYDNPHI